MDRKSGRLKKKKGRGEERKRAAGLVRRSWPGFVCLGMAACDGQAQETPSGLIHQCGERNRESFGWC